MDITKEILQKFKEYETFNPESEDCNYINKDYWTDLAKELNAFFSLNSVSQQRELLKRYNTHLNKLQPDDSELYDKDIDEFLSI